MNFCLLNCHVRICMYVCMCMDISKYVKNRKIKQETNNTPFNITDIKMKNRPTATNIVSEWEANVLFDADDPDFCGATSSTNNVLPNSVDVESINSTNIFIPPPPILDSISNNSFSFKGKLTNIYIHTYIFHLS